MPSIVLSTTLLQETQWLFSPMRMLWVRPWSATRKIWARGTSSFSQTDHPEEEGEETGTEADKETPGTASAISSFPPSTFSQNSRVSFDQTNRKYSGVLLNRELFIQMRMAYISHPSSLLPLSFGGRKEASRTLSFVWKILIWVELYTVEYPLSRRFEIFFTSNRFIKAPTCL